MSFQSIVSQVFALQLPQPKKTDGSTLSPPLFSITPILGTIKTDVFQGKDEIGKWDFFKAFSKKDNQDAFYIADYKDILDGLDGQSLLPQHASRHNYKHGTAVALPF